MYEWPRLNSACPWRPTFTYEGWAGSDHLAEMPVLAYSLTGFLALHAAAKPGRREWRVSHVPTGRWVFKVPDAATGARVMEAADSELWEAVAIDDDDPAMQRLIAAGLEAGGSRD